MDEGVPAKKRQLREGKPCRSARRDTPLTGLRSGARILLRDGNCCKVCKALNGAWISRDKKIGAYMADDGRVTKNDGTPAGWARGSEWGGAPPIKVVLTVAHLNHDESSNQDENLAALCQRHHLAHDRKDNQARAKATRHARKAVRELF